MVQIHVAISILALIAGIPVTVGLLRAQRRDGLTAIFLATTSLTSATGFFLPATHLLPSHIVGVLSLLLLAAAVYARYIAQLAGHTRALYVVTAVAAFYFNTFVAVVQAFLKVPALHALSPTQTEAPFAVAQLLVLVLFVAIGVLGVRRFHPAGPALQRPLGV